MNENIKTRVVLDDYPGINLKNALLEFADYLDSVLDQDWDIYVQPYLNGLQPDLVLVNDINGMHIIECNPETSIGIRRIKLIKEGIEDLYCPRAFIDKVESNLSDPAIHYSYADISRQASELQDEIGSGSKTIPNFTIIGSNFKELSLDEILPLTNSLEAIKYNFNAHYAEDLRAWLRCSDYKIQASQPLPKLDARQEELVTRDHPKFLKICGSAGSGKTMILAAKAAKFLVEGKKVLILTYNITLINYIRNLIHQNLNEMQHNDKAPIKYVISWFHRFAKTQLWNLGWGEDYIGLWKNGSASDVLNNTMAALLKKLSEEEDIPEEYKFDAILIDEGQDFLPNWWDGVKPFLADDGNACFVYDFRQDVYNRIGRWRETKFSLSGFIGRPNELKTAYRMPNTYIPKIQQFIDMYLQNQNDNDGGFEDLVFNLPEPAQQVDILEQCSTSWIQLENEADSDNKCIEAILDHSKLEVDDFAYSSLLFLTTSKQAGLRITRELIAQKVRVTNTFSTNSSWERSKKTSFNLHNDPIKATHVYSGKGFESSQIIFQITSKCNKSDVYTGLTRLKMGSNSQCSIIVICSNPLYREFAKIFNN